MRAHTESMHAKGTNADVHVTTLTYLLPYAVVKAGSGGSWATHCVRSGVATLVELRPGKATAAACPGCTG